MIMSKKKKKKKKSKKVDISLTLSFIAILISFFSLPMINKHFDKAKIEIIDMGLMKVDENLIQKYYLIKNNSGNTAKNIELHIHELDNRDIVFIGAVVKLIKDDNLGGIAKNKFYEIEELASGQEIGVIIYANFPNYLEVNDIDTLILNKPIPKPRPYYGPYIEQLKHSDGIEKPTWKNTITLTELR